MLAKDAYLVMRKRQTHKPSELTTKRKAVMAALRRQQSQHEIDAVSKLDDSDWMRLSCSFAMLNDRATAITALSNWLNAGGGYRARVAERLLRWPLVRWKLLTGMSTPAKVLQWLEDQRRQKAEAEAQSRLEREARRKEILRQRQERSYFGVQAWEQIEDEKHELDEQVVPDSTSISTEEAALQNHPAEGESEIVITGYDPDQPRSPHD